MEQDLSPDERKALPRPEKAGVFGHYLRWLEYDASERGKLRRLVDWTKADGFLRRLIAHHCLFLVFVCISIVAAVRESAQEQPAPEIAEAALEQTRKKALPPEFDSAASFLQDCQIQTELRDQALKARIETITWEEAVIFFLLVVVAVITFLLVVGGVVLIIAGNQPAGVTAEVLGLVPGIGTLTLARISRQLEKKRKRATDEMEGHVEVLQSIQTVLLLSEGPDRNRDISQLAQKLADSGLSKGRAS